MTKDCPVCGKSISKCDICNNPIEPKGELGHITWEGFGYMKGMKAVRHVDSIACAKNMKVS